MKITIKSFDFLLIYFIRIKIKINLDHVINQLITFNVINYSNPSKFFLRIANHILFIIH
jgi:hypothetical protein